MNVRVLGVDEWQLWRDLRLRALADSPDAYGRTLQSESVLPEEIWTQRLAGQTSIVAEVDGEPAGIGVARLDDADPSIGYIFAMWVAPEARRRGVGRAIVNCALNRLRELDATEARLSVTDGNEGARTLYESLGFVATGEREPLREGSSLQMFWMHAPL